MLRSLVCQMYQKCCMLAQLRVLGSKIALRLPAWSGTRWLQVAKLERSSIAVTKIAADIRDIAEARKPVKTAANQRLSTEHTTDIRGGTLSSHFMSHSFPRCCLELLDSSKAAGIYKSESLLLKSARLFSISMSPNVLHGHFSRRSCSALQ